MLQSWSPRHHVTTVQLVTVWKPNLLRLASGVRSAIAPAVSPTSSLATSANLAKDGECSNNLEIPIMLVKHRKAIFFLTTNILMFYTLYILYYTINIRKNVWVRSAATPIARQPYHGVLGCHCTALCLQQLYGDSRLRCQRHRPYG